MWAAFLILWPGHGLWLRDRFISDYFSPQCQWDIHFAVHPQRDWLCLLGSWVRWGRSSVGVWDLRKGSHGRIRVGKEGDGWFQAHQFVMCQLSHLGQGCIPCPHELISWKCGLLFFLAKARNIDPWFQQLYKHKEKRFHLSPHVNVLKLSKKGEPGCMKQRCLS